MTLAEQAARQGTYAKTKSDFAADKIAGSKLTKDLPLLATNLKNPKHQEFLFNHYKKEGLIPERFKTPKDLFDYVGRYIHSEKDRGILKPEDFNRRKGEILSELVQKEMISKLTDAQKADPELMEQISKMRWKGLPIKVGSDGSLSFNRRYYQDKVSKRVIDWANKIQDGLGDQWAKEMRASWKAIGEKNKKIKARSGLSFDIGHYIPSTLDGPNVGMNAAPELSSLNRAKGGTPNFNDAAIARQIGVPESWMQAFTDWHLRKLGMDPNNLPEGYEISGGQVANIAAGDTEATAEIAKNLQKAKADEQLIDVVESYKKQGLIPSETTVVGDGSKNPKIKSIDDLAQYGKIQPDFEIKNGKVVKKVNKPKSGVIQDIVRDGKSVFQATINNKKVDQVIDASSKVLDGGKQILSKIPKPIKVAGGALPIIGAVGDTSAIAGAVFDQNESVEQQEINDMKAISGGLGLTGFVYPPAWVPSTLVWGMAELKQMQLNRKEEKAKDLELFYMNKYIQARDEEGNPVPATLGSGKRTVNRRGRVIR